MEGFQCSVHCLIQYIYLSTKQSMSLTKNYYGKENMVNIHRTSLLLSLFSHDISSHIAIPLAAAVRPFQTSIPSACCRVYSHLSRKGYLAQRLMVHLVEMTTFFPTLFIHIVTASNTALFAKLR